MVEIVAEVKIEDVSSVKKKLSVEIPWANVKSELDQAYRAIGKKAKVKGFRSGKTPRPVLERFYKEEAENEAITNIITKTYSDALEKNDIQAVDQPVIDQNGIEVNKVFSFTATVEIAPVFEPQDYVELEVEKEEYEIGDSDVDARVEQIRQMYSTLESVEDRRDIQEGDFAVINFEGTVDGEAQKELTSENYLLEVGSHTLFPGFEEQLVGVKKEEVKEISVKFPEDYRMQNVAGKEAVFSVTVQDLKIKKLPDLDEEFIKNFEAYKTIDDLKKDIRETIEKETVARIEANVKNNLISKLLEKNDFEVPSIFVERQIYFMMLDAERRMIANGMQPEKAREISMNLHGRFEDEATRMVKTSILLNKIAEVESIFVEDQDVDNRLKELSERFAQDYESVKESYEQNNLVERMKDELLEQKTLDFLEEKAVITIVPQSEGETGGEE